MKLTISQISLFGHIFLSYCFLALSLKYLSALLHKTGYFLTASESRSSCCAAILIFFFCMFFSWFMKNYLAHIASRVHITKIMK